MANTVIFGLAARRRRSGVSSGRKRRLRLLGEGRLRELRLVERATRLSRTVPWPSLDLRVEIRLPPERTCILAQPWEGGEQSGCEVRHIGEPALRWRPIVNGEQSRYRDSLGVSRNGKTGELLWLDHGGPIGAPQCRRQADRQDAKVLARLRTQANARELIAQQQDTVECFKTGVIEERIGAQRVQRHVDTEQAKQRHRRYVAAAPAGQNAELAPAQIFDRVEFLARQKVDLLVVDMGYIANVVPRRRVLARLIEEQEDITVEDRQVHAAQLDEVAHVGTGAMPGDRQDSYIAADIADVLGELVDGPRRAAVGLGNPIRENCDRACSLGRFLPLGVSRQRQRQQSDRGSDQSPRQATHHGLEPPVGASILHGIMPKISDL